MDPASIAKLEANLVRGAAAVGGVENMQPIVLLLSGALSPVHRSHCDILHIAIDYLHHRLPPPCPLWTPATVPGMKPCVVLSVLAPSSREYLLSKLGDGAMTLESRCALCDVAARSDPDIGVVRYGIASASKACDRTYQDILQTLGPRCPKNLIVLPVYGSDFLLRARAVLGRPTIVVSREDEHDSTAAARRLLAESRLHPCFMFLDLETFQPPVALIRPFSSTVVRAALARGDRDVLLNILESDVLKALLGIPEDKLWERKSQQPRIAAALRSSSEGA